jgi:hypothetical protein
MAKTNKITQVKPNRARSERPDPQRLSKLFNLKRPGGNPSPTNPPFSKTNGKNPFETAMLIAEMPPGEAITLIRRRKPWRWRCVPSPRTVSCCGPT